MADIRGRNPKGSKSMSAHSFVQHVKRRATVIMWRVVDFHEQRLGRTESLCRPLKHWQFVALDIDFEETNFGALWDHVVEANKWHFDTLLDVEIPAAIAFRHTLVGSKHARHFRVCGTEQVNLSHFRAEGHAMHFAFRQSCKNFAKVGMATGLGFERMNAFKADQPGSGGGELAEIGPNIHQQPRLSPRAQFERPEVKAAGGYCFGHFDRARQTQSVEKKAPTMALNQAVRSKRAQNV